MEKHEKLKADANVRLGLFYVLKDLDIAKHGDMFELLIDKLLMENDMSGEEWDD